MIAQSIVSWLSLWETLRGRHPSQWPRVPRLLCAIAVMACVLLAGWQLAWLPQARELAHAEQEEQRLRDAYQVKAARARNLAHLRQQQAAVASRVAQLERQLPGKSEMDALLAEVNQAGVARGLQFEWFRPGKEQVSGPYAELAIDLRMSGNFHAFAAFSSDVANLSRIVNLDRITIALGRERALSFECVARTFRYLDHEERAGRAQPAEPSKGRVPA